MICYERVKRDCFWDLTVSDEDIDNMLRGGDFRKKKLLFEKILLNSTKLFEDLKLFEIKELEKLVEDYYVPAFNKEYIFRRKNLAEVYFLNKPLLINELKWII